MLRTLLVLAGVLPLLAFTLARANALPSVVDLLDVWFEIHCHRAPHRTLSLLGQLLPVCARCTGIYLGLLCGAALSYPRGNLRWLWVATAAAAALLGVDVATEALGWRVPSLGLRLATGVSFALPAAAAAVHGRRHLEPQSRR